MEKGKEIMIFEKIKAEANVKDDFCSVVVFAPTRGIAKSVALSSDILPDPEYLFFRSNSLSDS